MEKLSADPTELAAEAFEKFGNSILRLAFSYLHNLQDAEDVMQETIIQLVRTDPKPESPEHLKAWLLSVAANKSKNLLKYNRYRQHDDIEELEIPEETPEDLKYVWEAVNRLPEKYREVIHLFYAEDYPTKQISTILGIRESTVRSLLCRGREKLKEILKEEYDFDE